MKCLILLSFVITFAACRYHIPRNHHGQHNEEKLDVVELIKSNNYPAEKYMVETEDGYLLDLYRIPYGNPMRTQKIENQNQQQQQQQQQLLQLQQQSQQNSISQNQNENQDSKSSDSDSSSSSSEEDGIPRVPRPAVLMMHGVLSNAADFVIGGPEQGLAYLLADYGFDVFLGNARGSTYGRKHTVLHPDRDAAFWRYW